jgi:hypothetical protein
VRPRHAATVLLAIIVAALVAVGIYSHVHSGAKSSGSSTSSASVLGKNCTRGPVTYYADKAQKGSDRFDALQTGHALKPTVEHDVTKLCHDPSFAAAMVDFAHTGKIRPTKVNHLASYYLHHRKAWLNAVIGLLDKGTKKNGVSNPSYAVTSLSVKYDSRQYDTEGMVPHGKRLPTVFRSTQHHAAGWVLVEHLKNGQTRELRINCGEQPVVPRKPVKTVAARSPSGSTPRVVTVVYHQPPPSGCTGSSCGHRPPPPGCKTTHTCPPPPPVPHCKNGSSGPYPQCPTPPKSCKTTHTCPPPPPPPGCKTTHTCPPPPPHGCGCTTTTQVSQPVHDNSYVAPSAVQPTPGAPKHEPQANPVATTSVSAQAPSPAADNGPGNTAGYAGTGTGTGGSTPGGSTTSSGVTTSTGGSSATSNPVTGDSGTYSGSPTGPPS